MIKMSKYFLIFCLLISFSARAQHRIDSLNHYLAQGRAAYQEGDYPGFIDHLQQALKYLPGNGTIQYNMACGYAMMGDHDLASDILTRLIAQGRMVALRSLEDENFVDLRQTGHWPALAEQLEQLARPVENSTLWASLPEKDLIPEGIAVDPQTGDVYLSSIYKSKVVKVDVHGQVSDFVQEQAHGLGPTVGMKVDNARGLLWVASGVHDYNDRLDSAMIGMSGLFAFELTTGRLHGRYLLPQEGHFLNDLDVAADGTIYLTDSKHPAIYILKPDAQRLEKLLDIHTNFYPNGMALSPDGNLLYLSGTTTNVVDLKTLQVHDLKAPENTILSGDGLYFYEGSLIAVQNGEMNRIARFTLDASGLEVTSMEILEANHPDWIIPTTGSVYGNRFYYIGNSQLRAISREGKMATADLLKPVQVRVIEL